MKLMYLVLMTLSISAISAVECTDQDKTKWIEESKFKETLAKNYQIKTFKVTKGNCYEIYGKDQSGNRVEIYFNPVDGKIVKQK